MNETTTKKGKHLQVRVGTDLFQKVKIALAHVDANLTLQDLVPRLLADFAAHPERLPLSYELDGTIIGNVISSTSDPQAHTELLAELEKIRHLIESKDHIDYGRIETVIIDAKQEVIGAVRRLDHETIDRNAGEVTDLKAEDMPISSGSGKRNRRSDPKRGIA